MPAPQPYRLTGGAALPTILSQGLAGLFHDLWRELQFRPYAHDLGVERLRGSEAESRDEYMVRLGHFWLYYYVDEVARVVHLLDLVPIL